jgi:excisionase family DNA binding protein
MSDEKKPPASAVAPDPRLKIDREPFLDSHQAAAILKVHPRTLQRLVHRGEIAAVHVGKLWRFRASATRGLQADARSIAKSVFFRDFPGTVALP